MKELEELINDEQKAMLKAAAANGNEAVAEDRAAKRAKRKEERDRRKQERRASRASKKKAGTVLAKGKATLTGMFAKNQYRTSDVREAFASPSSILGPLTEATEAVVATVAGPSSPPSDTNQTEVDVAALEYEEWSMGEESESESSSSSDSSESNDASVTYNLADKEITIRPPAPGEEATTDAKENHEEDMDDGNDNDDIVGNAISALQENKNRGAPSRERNMSNVSTQSSSGGGLGRMRRKVKSKSMKARRSGGDGVSLERHGINRMSRRTMRLSRASVWIMRRDFQIFVTVTSVILVLVLGGAGVFWFNKCQATWLGVDLRVLKKEHDEFQSMEILQNAISEACRYESPREHDPNKPMLFQGGALSPVDLECMQSLELRLDDKMAWVTGVPNTRKEPQKVGFLNIHHFEKPPPQPKKNKYRRKKAWKFFRNDSSGEVSTSASSPNGVKAEEQDVDAAALDGTSLSEVSAEAPPQLREPTAEL